MIQAFFQSLFQAGLPIAALTAGLVWWSLRQGRLRLGDEGQLTSGDLDRMAKAHKKAKKDKKDKKDKKNSNGDNASEDDSDPHGLLDDASLDLESDLGLNLDEGDYQPRDIMWGPGKILPAMGGNHVLDKWLEFGGGFYGVVAIMTWLRIEAEEIWEFITGFDSFAALIDALSIGTLISLFIEGVMNFIAALVWPMTWIQNHSGNDVWIWFLMAWLSYQAGIRAGAWLYQRQGAAA